ncbi:MAG: tyrosine-protein phosphatase [Isosphaeraceae bacterium]|nr:tyrosine-protein phosphatase [Isosphaeraceae bacterium]
MLRGSAVFMLGIGLLFFRYLFLGNFAVVDPGKVYRSAQPKGALGWVRDYHLASILNLRGGSPADAWYASEVRACEREGIDFYDLPMVATRRPTRAELLVLLDLLERCEYPLLIHCKSGSDRTGLASALYRLSVLAEPPERASEAFSVWRGHFPIGGPELLQEPVKEYSEWLKSRGMTHTPQRFRQWVEHDYRSGGSDSDLEIPLRPGARPQITTATERARK